MGGEDLTASYQFKPIKLGGGGFVTGLQIHPKEGGPIYARTDVGGVYRWDPVGSVWKQLIVAGGLPETVLEAEAVDSGDGTPGPGYRRVSLYQTESIAIDPSDPEVLFVAAGNTTSQPGTLLKSTDGGASFEEMNLTVPMAGNASYRFFNERLAVKPDDSSVVLFGSRTEGLQRSTDGGMNWSRVETVPIGDAVEEGAAVGVGPVVFDPSTPERAYCSVAQTGIFRSDDAGATWEKISDQWADRMSCSQGVLYVARVGQGVSKYTVDGTWTSIDPGGDKSIADVAVDPADAAHLYAIRSGGQSLYRSTDGGENWTKLKPSSVSPEGRALFQSTNIPWVENTNVRDWLSVGTLVFDPREPGTLWFSEGMGVWKSTDATPENDAPTFVNTSQGIEELVAGDILASPGGKVNLVMRDRVGFHRTHETLDEFPEEQIGLSQEFGMGITLASSAGTPGFLVASVADSRTPPVMGGYDGWGVSSGFSEDGGETWEVFGSVDQSSESNDPETLMFGEIVVSADDTDRLVWLPRLPHWFIKDGKAAYNEAGRPEEAQAIHYSEDRGATWQRADIGDYEDLRQEYLTIKRSLAADPVDGDTFYAYDTGGRIFASVDGGETWAERSAAGSLPSHAFSNVLRAVPGKAGHLWFASGWDYRGGAEHEGFYRSPDGGSTWSKAEGFSTTWQFGFGKPKIEGGYPTLFVYGRYQGEWGLYRSTDEGSTWELLSRWPLGIVDHVVTVAGDPDIFGRVYLGWAGNGFAYGTPIDGQAKGEEESE